MQSQDTGIIRFRSFVTGSDVVADVTRGIGDGHAQFERKHKRTQRKYTQSLHRQTSHDRPQHLFLGRLRTGLFRRVRILRQIRVCRRIQIRVGSRVIAIARQIVFLCERFPAFALVLVFGVLFGLLRVPLQEPHMPQPFLPREESEVLDGGGERQRVERAVEHRLGPSELAGGVTQTKQVDELFGVDESGRNRQLVAHGVDEQQHRQHADGLLLRT